MKTVKIKRDIGSNLKAVCDSLSEKQRKGVLVGMLVVSIILCGMTLTRAFGRFFSHGAQQELPFGKYVPVDSLHRTDKDSITYHSKSMDNGR